jgi:hypothetical protein
MPRELARLAAFAALAVASFVAAAADDAPVKAPYIEVGDCWKYRAENLDNRGQINEYEECVTFVDREKDVIFALIKPKGDGREIETSYTSTWGRRTDRDGTIHTYVKGQDGLKWPLRVGDTATSRSEFRRALLGTNAGKMTWHWKVVGWEDVTVPAGKFRALKVEGNGTVERTDVWLNFPVKFVSWYVPEVNRSVKNWFENPDGRRGVELTGYKLNK